MLQAATLASDAGLPDGGHATPPMTGGSGSDEDGDDGEPAAAVQGIGQRARAAAAAAQALAEEPQATGQFKQSGFYIPHARCAGFSPISGDAYACDPAFSLCRGQAIVALAQCGLNTC